MQYRKTKSTLKKISILLLSMIMILCLLPTGVYAEDEKQEETKQQTQESTGGSDEEDDETSVKKDNATENSFSVKWISGSGTISNDGSLISNTPSSNVSQTAQLEVFFQLARDTSAAAGEVEIRIPLDTFFASATESDISLALGGTQDFDYYIDGNEVVFYNINDIDSSKSYTWQMSYYYMPYYVETTSSASGNQSTLNKQIEATLNINDEKDATVDLDISVTTKVNASVSKNINSTNPKYEEWQTYWGDEPEGSSDYFYLVWTISVSGSGCTQPYTVTAINDVIPQSYIEAGAYIVGYTPASSLSSTNFIKSDELSTGLGTATSAYRTIVVAYPRSLYQDLGEEATSVSISNTATGTIDGSYGATSSGTANRTYTYEEPSFTYTGDSFSVSKGTVSAYSYGGINVLENNEELSIGATSNKYNRSFYITANARGYNLTNDGTDSYTVDLIDDLLYLGSTQLQPGDYSIDSFYMNSLVEYTGAYDTSSGTWKETASSDYGTYSELEVYYKTVDDDLNWIKYGTIKRTGTSTYIFTYASDNTTKTVTQTSQIALPDGACGIKFSYKTSAYKVIFTPYIGVTLNPTDHVKELIEDKNSIYLYNVDSLIVKDKNGTIVNSGESETSSLPTGFNNLVYAHDTELYGAVVQHYYSYSYLTRLNASSYISKTSGTATNDTTALLIKIPYTVNTYEYLYAHNSISLEDIKETGIFNIQNEGVFYDLLPEGAYADVSTINVKTYGGNKSCSFTYELVDNWQGSGQTMLIVYATYTGTGDNIYSYIYTGYTYYTSGFVLTYDLSYSWDSYYDYGGSLLNSVAYRTSEGTLSGGKTASSSGITKKEYYKNLTDSTGASDPDDTNKNTIYTQVTKNISFDTSAKMGFWKEVKALDSYAFSNTDEVYTNQYYQYRLRYVTNEVNSNATATNIVFYDQFETNYGSNPYWQGSFAGVDTTYLENTLGVPNVTVYYSTETVSLADGTAPSLNESIWNWTTSEPSDLSDVTAIAVDLGDYVLEDRTAAFIYITMKAPNTVDYEYINDEDYLAYNKAYLTATIEPESGGQSYEASYPDTATVSILPAKDLTLYKYDSNERTVLEGAEFKLYRCDDETTHTHSVDPNDSEGCWTYLGTQQSGNDGSFTFEGLLSGAYLLVETKTSSDEYSVPIDYWLIDIDAYESGSGITNIETTGDSVLDIKYDSTNEIYKVLNQKETNTGSITLNKLGDDENPLEGATFLLEKKNADNTWTAIQWDETTSAWVEDTEKVGSTTTNTGTIIYQELDLNTTYRITELAAPEGYSLLKETIEVTLPYEKTLESNPNDSYDLAKDNGNGTTTYYYYNITYTITDVAKVDMPKTGVGMNQMTFILMGIAMVLMACLAYVVYLVKNQYRKLYIR